MRLTPGFKRRGRASHRRATAKELVVAIGRGGSLLRRSHDRDFPSFVEALPNRVRRL